MNIRAFFLFFVVLMAGCGSQIGANDTTLDKDLDGFVNAANGGDDCNDSNPDVNPDAVEACDNQDNDCDGLIDCEDDMADGDGDGVCVCDDCDDKDKKNYEGNREVCDGQDNDCDGFADCVDLDVPDADGDGSCTCNDCDDRDRVNYPGNPEICDGKDNNCDRVPDDGLTFQDWYQDTDGDGHGDPTTLVNVCTGAPGSDWVTVGDDCDDNDGRNFPGNNEACDAQDNDCDTDVDEGLAFLDLYRDADGDGWGDDNDTLYTCPGLASAGYVVFKGDCDDNNDQVAPDKEEVCDGIDNDCDTFADCADPKVADADADGVCVCDDCDDREGWNYPGNTEICDGQDNDCNSQADCDDSALADLDGDGDCVCTDCDDADPLNLSTSAELCDGQDNDCDGKVDCADPDVGDGDSDGVCACQDCDDADQLNYPGNRELCDGKDNDCDTVADDGLSFVKWYEDKDGDGRGDPASEQDICDGPPAANWVQVGDDCDDNDAANYPTNNEACDGQDNNCDSQIDEGLTTQTLFADTDGDGYGDPNVTDTACLGGGANGFVSRAGDCDDTTAAVNPGAAEACNSIDDDCDTLIDCNDGDVQDADADGFCVCDDCDDLALWNFPGNPEICDGEDNDCDGNVDCADNDVADGDSDGSCVCDDCDDNDTLNFPGNAEMCDTQDNDCDGFIDCADSDTPDSDGDGVCACIDCDDANANAFPGNLELCDGIDSDCDGLTPAPELTDGDGDGYVQCDDCDDTTIASSPIATEICDGKDNDCDGNLPADEVDADQDGYWKCEDCDDLDPLVFVGGADTDGDGFSECEGDCAPNDILIFPGATDTCDYVDNNCDGAIDEAFVTAGRYETDAHCGICGNDCAGYTFDNAAPYCDTSPAIPECAPSCQSGWYDANLDYSDGCECFFTSATDRPFDGIDEDCNGDDGDHATAIHVALWGRDGATGTITDPVRDVQDGVDLAVSSGFSFVLVSQGAFYESVQLTPGVSLIGGYEYYFGDHDPARFETILDGQTTTAALPGTVNLNCNGSAQRVQGFTIYGTLPDDLGESSYGVYLADCDGQVEVTDNLIIGRTGADGMDGLVGAHGELGSDGIDGEDAQATDCTSPPLGGAGGALSCADPSRAQTVDGGTGGGTVCPIIDAEATEAGNDGMGTSPGTGGLEGSNCELQAQGPVCSTCTITAEGYGPGGIGQTGGDGPPGREGIGCAIANGSVSGGLFVGGAGLQGETGYNGSGGGGGAAGGGAESSSVQKCGESIAGGTGGGGGSGGCGAEGGYGGSGGGGSFGIFMTYSAAPATFPIIDNNIVQAGDGGTGGNGGSGGVGGLGGLGGQGGAQGTSGNAGWGRAGGVGGNGGSGGHGGGGGGGCGGPSFGLFVDGATPAANYGNTSTLAAQAGGVGGAGGYGPGGTSGTPGGTGGFGAKNF